MIFFAISIIAFILWSWYRKRKNHFLLFQKIGIDGPKPNILFGNFFEIFVKGTIKSQKEWISKYGKVLGYYYGLTPVLLVTDTELLRKIQIKDFQKFIDRSNTSLENLKIQRLNQHLVNLKGAKWKEMRNVITPFFTASKIKMILPILNDATATLLENFEKAHKSGEIFEAYNLFQKLTLDVIIRAAFGLQTNVQKNSEDPLFKLTYILFHFPFRFFFLLLTKSFTFFQPVNRLFRIISGFIINRGVNPVHDLLDKCEIIVKSRKEDPMNRRMDLLQLLIEAEVKENIKIDCQMLTASDKTVEEIYTYKDTKNVITRHLTIDEMTANAYLFLLAGYETTSTALAFTTLMLANFPEVQDKLRMEINEILQEEKYLDYGSVQKLQYMDQTLKEILRLYPPVYLFTERDANENVRYDKILIPKGMVVQVPVYLIHRDTDYWEQPEEFRPERFSPENAKKNNPLAWQAFGAGPRNCVGMRFAQMEAKLVLAHILHRYRILSCENTDKYPFELDLTPNVLRPKYGVRVRLEKC